MQRKHEVVIFVSLIVILAAATVAGRIFSGSIEGLHQNVSYGPPPVNDSTKWVKVFSDDFNGNALDTTKWVTCYDWRPVGASGCTNGGNNEQEWYMPQQVAVHNGSVALTAIKDPITMGAVYPYRSGMISTGRQDSTSEVKWSGKYGYYEARMHFDGGQGVWPAFWLLPTDRSWPPEIDIMEMLGQHPNQVLLTTHWQDSNGQREKDSGSIQGSDFTKGWHTYAVNWQPQRIDWYVDGALKKTVTGKEVPNTRMEIILDLAVGGALPGNVDSTTPFPRTMQVDYVHVYAHKQ